MGYVQRPRHDVFRADRAACMTGRSISIVISRVIAIVVRLPDVGRDGKRITSLQRKRARHAKENARVKRDPSPERML